MMCLRGLSSNCRRTAVDNGCGVDRAPSVRKREGKLRFKTSAALRLDTLMGKGIGANPEEKSRAGVRKAV